MIIFFDRRTLSSYIDKEMQLWFYENLLIYGRDYYMHTNGIDFYNDEDATAFKLKFGL